MQQSPPVSLQPAGRGFPRPGNAAASVTKTPGHVSIHQVAGNQLLTLTE